ncbi:hypothetical protein [Absidia glauca]|uniref:Uncharacterized protein n=1 Tax=Absidia glauca TaxID=4829 RepID=A0A168S6E9_ABSGL|nr:hypothetical protein [Absidia glauca]
MRFQFAICFIIAALMWSANAVPELEHDMTEIDMHDCRFFTKLSCIRECPKNYVGVYRSLCSAAEDQHECCAVRCCRSRHDDEQEADEMDEGYRSPYATQSRSRFHRV